MRMTALVFGLISASVLALGTDTASAQATRTWVSGVGDDVNPCSRTAPCKTWAGAISKTAAGGEIDALDPGGFGAVTITKAITLDGGGGIVASILVAGTNGIVVAAGASDVVRIRNLSINGVVGTASPGLNGIRFLSGAALHVEHCNIMNFSQNGIEFAPSSAAQMNVLDTTTTNNTGGGIRVAPQSGGSAKVSIFRTAMNGNVGYGLRADGTTAGSGNVLVTVTDSQTSGNTNNGVNALSGPGTVTVILNRVAVANNGANGVQSNQAAGATSSVYVGYSNITGNNVAGNPLSGGAILSYGNNEINGNLTSDGTFGAATLH